MEAEAAGSKDAAVLPPHADTAGYGMPATASHLRAITAAQRLQPSLQVVPVKHSHLDCILEESELQTLRADLLSESWFQHQQIKPSSEKSLPLIRDSVPTREETLGLDGKQKSIRTCLEYIRPEPQLNQMGQERGFTTAATTFTYQPTYAPSNLQVTH